MCKLSRAPTHMTQVLLCQALSCVSASSDQCTGEVQCSSGCSTEWLTPVVTLAARLAGALPAFLLHLFTSAIFLLAGVSWLRAVGLALVRILLLLQVV